MASSIAASGLPAYLPGLDFVRVMAAVSVFCSHLLLIIPGFRFGNGGNAVILFFTLSGFLITYLFLRERAATGRIAIRAFYIRRALRIMPLYFLVLLAVMTQPAIRPHLSIALVAAMFLSPFARGDQVGIGHFWTISVEEFYYLIYPPLVARFGVVRVCTAMIVVYNLLLDSMPHALERYRIDTMALGGLAAWLCVNRQHWVAVLYRWPVALASFLFTLYMLGQDWPPRATPMAAVFAVFVVSAAFNPAFRLLDSRVVTWLGQRTYGIYLWHFPVLLFIYANLQHFTTLSALLVGIIATLGLAAASYALFEAPILRFKQRFAPRHPKRIYCNRLNTAYCRLTI